MNGNFYRPGIKRSRGNWAYSGFAPPCFPELVGEEDIVLIT